MFNLKRRLHTIAHHTQSVTERITHADLAATQRRLTEWADTGHSPGQPDNPRRTGPADPTAAKATNPTDLTYHGHTHIEIINRNAYWLPLLDKVLADATRPHHATPEELDATEYTSERRRRGRMAGTCDACGRACTGAAGDELRPVATWRLCMTHYKGARRIRTDRGETVDSYIQGIAHTHGRQLKGKP